MSGAEKLIGWMYGGVTMWSVAWLLDETGSFSAWIYVPVTIAMLTIIVAGIASDIRNNRKKVRR